MVFDVAAKFTSLTEDRQRMVMLVAFSIMSGIYSTLFFELTFDSVTALPPLVDAFVAAVFWMGVLAAVVAATPLDDWHP